MEKPVDLDTDFRFDTDTPPGKDPDSHSPTLRRYHKMLWSKTLPDGHQFNLEDTHAKSYLYHNSDLGEFFLSSDAITHSYKKTKRIAHVIAQVPSEIVDGVYLWGSTIGAYTLFPGNRIENKATINALRGMNSQISDRFDISLECIRRHYQGIESPLTVVLNRYRSFFSLFQDFQGYVDFFHLQDLVVSDYSAVKFHIPYTCFTDDPLPRTKDLYLEYSESTIKFIKSRAARMKSAIRAR